MRQRHNFSPFNNRFLLKRLPGGRIANHPGTTCGFKFNVDMLIWWKVCKPPLRGLVLHTCKNKSDPDDALLD